MNRLLKIEWLKIIHYRTAWVFLLLYFLLLILMGIFIPQIRPTINETEIDFVQYGAYNFPVVWHNITYFAAIGKIFLAVIIVTNVTNEYSNGTLKQNLIDGLSKKEFLLSKLIGVLLLTLLSTLIVSLIALNLGLRYGTTDPVSLFEGAEYVGAYALKLLFFFTFVLFLSFLFRKTAFALLMLFVWWVIESILTMTELYVRKLMGQDLESVTLLYHSFLPLNASSALIPFPRINLDHLLQGVPIFVAQPLAWEPVLTTVVYTALFAWLSYVLLKKRNL